MFEMCKFSFQPLGGGTMYAFQCFGLFGLSQPSNNDRIFGVFEIPP